MIDKKNYVNATDEDIIDIKQHQELLVWIDHLKYVIKECNQLIKIDAKIKSVNTTEVKVSQLNNNLVEMKNRTVAFVDELQNYRGKLSDFKECNDLECDLFFIKNHDDFRSRYLSHLKAYRLLKDRMYNVMINSYK